MNPRDRLNLFIVSDATGATAESVVTSVLVQFRGQEFNIRRFPFVRTRRQIERIMEEAPEERCIVVFTLVSEKLREFLLRRCREKRLTTVDLIGPLLGIASRILRRAPQNVPGALHHADEEAKRLAAAIHYTRQHDDGQGLDSLDQADLIILGVSRTGKTPTSIYLSCRKLKVANIPIVYGVPFPEHVAGLPVKKVGFRMEVERLKKLRQERARRLVRPRVAEYAEEKHILNEVEYCDRVYRKIPGLWVIDVTYRSIEEISEWITHYVL